MKVLVTGSNGFIGKNLISHLNERKDVDLITYDKEDKFEKITDNLKDIDFIFHLAGVNRPKDVKEFYEGNTNLTEDIIKEIEKQNLDIPILITSSIQAQLDNDYGKSKKQAEELLKKYGENHQTYIFRLHNVFGKWCMPNYNSVIATFCYNTANDIDIRVDDEEKVLKLIYIDDIMYEFLNVLDNKAPTNVDDGICYVSPVYEKKLGDIAKLIKSFKKNFETIWVPETGDDFTRKMFSTYLSYVKTEDLVMTPKMNIDNRGSFTELIRTEKYGQVSVSVSKPGIVRGNHYHHTKMEKFIVVKGQAEITFKHIITGEMMRFKVDDRELKIVNIPVGYSHKIENTGEGEMILLIWCNELFDEKKPDTYFKEINLGGEHEKIKSYDCRRH